MKVPSIILPRCVMTNHASKDGTQIACCKNMQEQEMNHEYFTSIYHCKLFMKRESFITPNLVYGDSSFYSYEDIKKQLHETPLLFVDQCIEFTGSFETTSPSWCFTDLFQSFVTDASNLSKCMDCITTFSSFDAVRMHAIEPNEEVPNGYRLMIMHLERTKASFFTKQMISVKRLGMLIRPTPLN